MQRCRQNVTSEYKQLKYKQKLQYISDICALDKFIISRKQEVHPIIFQW